ncbi:hypothetical protein PRIPAC_96304 [Pristionchus pacificus]|uniref:Uncharacterized protein n=1 Tax=Pristionchus pacificus TaxID=54126 RepID=A0A2A6B320_PRIPA|nr:hypothetical protein PRIPAC_96304 [Pristionchus pacificus]|eukprot:PDM60275.1 hypothetical protein PRIPAC_54100 [Pristionchus pacificus]
MFKFVFAFVLIVALAVGFASAGKACVDEPDAFCNIVGQFCDNKTWAAETANKDESMGWMGSIRHLSTHRPILHFSRLMAILHIGREAPTTKKFAGMRKWAALFILATVLLSLLTALIFLYYLFIAPALGVPAQTASYLASFFGFFIAFIVVGLVATVLTSAAIILNKQPLALAVFAVAVIHILLTVPLIVFAILSNTVFFQIGPIISFHVLFLLDLIVAAALAVTALLTFLEMRKSRSLTVIQPAQQPTVAFMTTVNRSPSNRSPAPRSPLPPRSPVTTTRSYESRVHVSSASSSARYLS